MKNTVFQDHRQESLFLYTIIKLISDYYLQGYRLLIAMACYQYAFSSCFEDQTKFKMESGTYSSIYIP